MAHAELESIVALAAALARAQQLHRQDGGSEAVFDALDGVERAIFSHKAAFGVQSERFQRGCEEFLLLASTATMQALHRRCLGPDASLATVQRCGDLLVRAEQHTRRAGYLRSLPSEGHATRRLALRFTCLNNLACYYKQVDKPWAAVACLEKALKLQLRQGRAPPSKEEKEEDQDEDDEEEDSDAAASPAAMAATGRAYAIALTRLNLAAVLSQLQRHTAAADHAKAAVAELVSTAETGGDARSSAELLVVAYYNLAVELEHGGERAKARDVYERALQVAARHSLSMGLVEDIREILAESVGRRTKTKTRTPRSEVTVAPSASPSRRSPRRPLSPYSLRQLCGSS